MEKEWREYGIGEGQMKQLQPAKTRMHFVKELIATCNVVC